MIRHMEDWYGYSKNSYSLVMSPLLGPMGYGPATVAEDGAMDLYCIMGFIPPNQYSTALMNLSYMFFHEFSHSYVNPLIDLHFDELEKYEYLFEPIRQQMSNQAYTTWWVCLAEHFVRGTEIRIRENYMPDYDPKAAMRREMNRGFIYIEAIYDSVVRYEQSRGERQLVYRDFFPEMVRDFIEAAERIARESRG